MGLTDAGITVRVEYGEQVDTAPVFLTTPNPRFIAGTPLTYPFAQDISDDGLSPVTYTLSNQLPDGLNYGTDTGILSYDGIAHVPNGSVSSHQLTVTDAVGSAQSSAFNITVEEVTAGDVSVSQTIPALTIATGQTIDMSVYITGPLGSVVNSEIQGLDTDLATYSHSTKLLTGVTTGVTQTGLTYVLTT
jgi:hypothetical protein